MFSNKRRRGRRCWDDNLLPKEKKFMTTLMNYGDHTRALCEILMPYGCKFLSNGVFGSVYGTRELRGQRKKKYPIAVKEIPFDKWETLMSYQRMYMELSIPLFLEKCSTYHVVRPLRRPYTVFQPKNFGKFDSLYVNYERGGGDLRKTITKGIPMKKIKLAMFQMARAVFELHSLGILHLDVKPENFVFFKQGNDNVLKIIDFGISCSSNNPHEFDESFGYLVSLWYRPPELMIKPDPKKCSEQEDDNGAQPQTPLAGPQTRRRMRHPPSSRKPPSLVNGKIDVWSLGQIFVELIISNGSFDGPLFNGWDVEHQLSQIHSFFANDNGAAAFKELAKFMGLDDRNFLNLITGMLAYNQKDRFSMDQVLFHPFFAKLVGYYRTELATFQRRNYARRFMESIPKNIPKETLKMMMFHKTRLAATKNTVSRSL